MSIYLATSEEIATIFTSRSDCPLICKIDSLLLIGIIQNEHNQPSTKFIDPSILYMFSDSDNEDDAETRSMMWTKIVASGWCGMWIKAIALHEEHGMVPVPCGDYSIDGIREIKSTDGLMECYYNDTEEIQSYLIRERCLRYFSSLNDLNAICFSVKQVGSVFPFS